MARKIVLTTILTHVVELPDDLDPEILRDQVEECVHPIVNDGFMNDLRVVTFNHLTIVNDTE